MGSPGSTLFCFARQTSFFFFFFFSYFFCLFVVILLRNQQNSKSFACYAFSRTKTRFYFLLYVVLRTNPTSIFFFFIFFFANQHSTSPQGHTIGEHAGPAFRGLHGDSGPGKVRGNERGRVPEDRQEVRQGHGHQPPSEVDTGTWKYNEQNIARTETRLSHGVSAIYRN